MPRKLITDAFFQQGSSHEVCEDYAVSGPNFAIVSDGCSNGGGPSISSDWGARFLCKSAEEFIETVDLRSSTYMFLTTVLVNSNLLLRNFKKLDPRCLTATLIIVQQIEESFEWLLVGDGVIAAQRHDGTWTIKHFEFLPGGASGRAAPFYLSYTGDHNDVRLYLDQFGGHVQVDTYNGPLSNPTKTSTTGTLDFTDPEGWTFKGSFPLSEYKACYILSDGITSFMKKIQSETDKRVEPVNLISAIEMMFRIPLIRPGFLNARRNWAFKQNRPDTFQRAGWYNYDDVSVGGIHCVEN